MHSLTTDQMMVLLVAGGVIVGIYLMWQARKLIVAAAAVAVVFAGWTMYHGQIDDFISKALQQAQPQIRQIEETLPQPTTARQQPKEHVQVTITPQPPQMTVAPVQAPYRALITGKVEHVGQGSLMPVIIVIDDAGGVKVDPAYSHNQCDGVIDTGAFQTSLPDKLLRHAGYVPIKGPYTVTGVGGNSQAYDYEIPYPAIWQDDIDRFVRLGTGTIRVVGIVGFSQALIGPDIINRNSFSITGDTWVLGVK